MNLTTRSRRIPITDERRAKMHAARSEQAERRKSWRERPLLSAGRWVLFRLDERNYVITDKRGDEASWRFYPRIADALSALLHETIGEKARPGLQALLEAVRSAEKAVLTALLSGRCVAESLDETPGKCGCGK